MMAAEFKQIGGWIADILEHPTDEAIIARVREEVMDLCDGFPLYPEFRGVHERV